VRLVTLTGPGGAGKTRLAYAVAEALLHEFAGGVSVVDLGGVGDAGLVPATIAQALGLKETGGEPVDGTLKGWLRERELLLLLDGFEQLLPVAPYVAGLLAAAPGVKIIVTSRASLRVSGEYEFRVPPLALPDKDDGRAELDVLAQVEAVALFVERARAVRVGFELATQNAAAVVEICIRLDGLPLAIELAAARTASLSPQAIVERLEHPLQLLTRGARDLPDRQQTLRATLDWSYALLDPGERDLFARLAVFVAGFSLSASEEVCGAGIDELASLVDKSLLVLQDAPNEERFRMLDTIREYALEQLEASGGAEAARRGHAAFFAALAERAEPELTGERQAAWLERLEPDHDNVRAALAWAHEADEHELELRLAAAIARFWYVRGHLGEGRRWLEQALAGAEAPPQQLRAKALMNLGALAFTQGDYLRAKASLDESLRLSRLLRDERGIAHALSGLGNVAVGEGDHDGARQLFEESRTVARDAGERRALAIATNNLGVLALGQADYEWAEQLFEETLRLITQVGDPQAIAIALAQRGFAVLHQGRHAEALTLLRQGVAQLQELGDRASTSYCLEGLAALAAARGKREAAARILGASERLRRNVGVVLEGFDRAMHERTVEALRGQLAVPAIAAELALGRMLSLEQAVDYAFRTLSVAEKTGAREGAE
jgi:predicted ATPase